MSKPAFILTDDSVTVFIDDVPMTVDRQSHVVADISAELSKDAPDLDVLRNLLDPAQRFATALAGTEVDVNLTTSVVTYKGRRIAPVLEHRLIDVLSWGFPIDPWKRFVKKVYANPDKRAREELLLFMEGSDLPLTEDGDIIAWKRVNADYKDCRTGTLDNSIGQTVTMDRSKVDPDRYRTCSAGLHFCSKEYLSSFGGAHTMVVKINPADVVAIPSDYNNSKGRTWKYEVVGEVENEAAPEKQWGAVDTEYTSYDEYEDDEDFDIDFDDPEFEDDDVVTSVEEVNPTAFVTPIATPKRSWWKAGMEALKKI